MAASKQLKIYMQFKMYNDRNGIYVNQIEIEVDDMY